MSNFEFHQIDVGHRFSQVGWFANYMKIHPVEVNGKMKNAVCIRGKGLGKLFDFQDGVDIEPALPDDKIFGVNYG